MGRRFPLSRPPSVPCAVSARSGGVVRRSAAADLRRSPSAQIARLQEAGHRLATVAMMLSVSAVLANSFAGQLLSAEGVDADFPVSEDRLADDTPIG